MNVLLALLAFAGVMVVLSTIVTVIVEALHKFFVFRRTGLEEMLRSLHDNALAPRLYGDNVQALAAIKDAKDHGSSSPEAMRFARQMTESPAFGGGGRWWWLRNAPILNWIFHRRFERLSTLEFAEQLARTDAGLALSAKDPTSMKDILTAASYEFERYGDAQSDYFKRRAKAFSVIVAILFAFALNVDAVQLFKTLARDQNVAQAALSKVDSAQLQTFSTQANSALAKLNASLEGASPALQPAAPGAPAAAQGGAKPEVNAAIAELNLSVQTLSSQVDATKQTAWTLSELGLPIGHQVFPFCRGAEDIIRLEKQNLRDRALGLTVVQAPPLRDERCRDMAVEKVREQDLEAEKNKALLALGQAPAQKGFSIAKFAGEFGEKALQYNYLIWFGSVLLAGGLLGLGAPFWFDIFRRLSAFAPQLKALQSGGQPAAAGGGAVEAPKPQKIRDWRAQDENAVHRAFQISAGLNPDFSNPLQSGDFGYEGAAGPGAEIGARFLSGGAGDGSMRWVR